MIRLNAGFRADLEWWHAFVADWNGVSMIRRGELKQGERMWSDASGSGALWEEKWLQIAWTEWPGFETENIAAKELFPIVVAAATWGSSWRGQVVCCHCDNQAVVAEGIVGRS